MKAKMNKISFWIEETNVDNLKKYWSRVLRECGFNILSFCEHYFQPYGWTGLYLLSESHFAVHTFPEENKTYIELSSCIDTPYNSFLKSVEGIKKIDVK